MPSHKKSKQSPVDKEYEDKRARNNEAVRRSRAKAKERAKEVQSRINNLKNENDDLEERKKLLSKELTFLKELFMKQSGKFILT